MVDPRSGRSDGLECVLWGVSGERVDLGRRCPAAGGDEPLDEDRDGCERVIVSAYGFTGYRRLTQSWHLSASVKQILNSHRSIRYVLGGLRTSASVY